MRAGAARRHERPRRRARPASIFVFAIDRGLLGFPLDSPSGCFGGRLGLYQFVLSIGFEVVERRNRSGGPSDGDFVDTRRGSKAHEHAMVVSPLHAVATLPLAVEGPLAGYDLQLGSDGIAVAL